MGVGRVVSCVDPLMITTFSPSHNFYLFFKPLRFEPGLALLTRPNLTGMSGLECTAAQRNDEENAQQTGEVRQCAKEVRKVDDAMRDRCHRAGEQLTGKNTHYGISSPETLCSHRFIFVQFSIPCRHPLRAHSYRCTSWEAAFDR